MQCKAIRDKKKVTGSNWKLTYPTARKLSLATAFVLAAWRNSMVRFYAMNLRFRIKPYRVRTRLCLPLQYIFIRDHAYEFASFEKPCKLRN